MSVSSVVARHALFVIILAVPLSAGAALTLAEAERLALERAPWYQHHRTNVSAAAERIEYEGRLPDPQLTVGVVNVPTTTYDLRSEDMTMTNVGVRQQFPPGDTLKLRSQRARQELTREEARLEMERRNLLRQVRNGWLELYYLDRSLALLDRSRVLQHRLLEDTEGRYRAAGGGQSEVLQARQMLGRLDERIAMLRAQRARTQALLSRWVGETANQPLPEKPAAARAGVARVRRRAPPRVAGGARRHRGRPGRGRDRAPGIQAGLHGGPLVRPAARARTVPSAPTFSAPS